MDENTKKPQINDKKKRKKARKKPRAVGFPRFPRNGYVRFCNEIRPIVCAEDPSKDPVEVTKRVAQLWLNSEAEKKQPYMTAAKLDKERFKKELKEYYLHNPEETKMSNAKKKTNHKLKDLSQLPSTTSTVANAPSTSVLHASEQKPDSNDKDSPKTVIGLYNNNHELPIFTPEFIDHNKKIEIELKSLRKANVEIEQHNSVLLKHIENMQNGVRKLEDEISSAKSKNLLLEIYLTKLRCTLASGFADGGATVENVDKFMSELSSEATAQKSPAAVNRARDIIRKIDLKFSA